MGDPGGRADLLAIEELASGRGGAAAPSPGQQFGWLTHQLLWDRQKDRINAGYTAAIEHEWRGPPNKGVQQIRTESSRLHRDVDVIL